MGTPPEADLQCRISNRRFSKVLGPGWTYRLRFIINASLVTDGRRQSVSNVTCRWTVKYAPLDGGDWRNLRSGTKTVSTVRSDRWTGDNVTVNLGSRGKGRYRLVLEIDPDHRFRDPNRSNNVHSELWRYR